MSSTRTATRTYTEIDVEKVMTRVGTDIKMIADSTRGWDAATTANCVHDVQELAVAGYLEAVDLTLLDAGREVKAARFVVSESASGWTNQRPGDALWPRLANSELRIVLIYNASYDAEAHRKMASKLKNNWTPCLGNVDHGSLQRGGNRSYASSSYGVQRMDWAA